MDSDSHSHRWFNPKPKEATTFTGSLWSVWVSSLILELLSSLWSVKERARDIKFWLFWFFSFLVFIFYFFNRWCS